MTKIKPTEQQQHAIDLAVRGNGLRIEALAGTGKTSTLKAIAEGLLWKKGLYSSFNSAIVSAARQHFPRSVSCKTVHSLALKTTERSYPWIRNRLTSSARISSIDIANRLNIDPMSIPNWTGGKPKTLTPRRIANLVISMVDEFCRSSDSVISENHLPHVKNIDAQGETTIQKQIAKRIVKYANAAWRDLTQEMGQLRFKHDIYLKLWQLSNPQLPFDYLLVDEAQDLNPVMCDVVQNQKSTQIIGVGDSRQQIYEWNGAINALKIFRGESVYLTKSFRFGEQIADVANQVLHFLDEDIQVQGVGGPSSVAHDSLPDAILCRTNATTLTSIIQCLENNQRVWLQGGSKEIRDFAQAAKNLHMGQPADHPELSCFENWQDLAEYIDQDADGSDLKMLFNLVDQLGPEKLIATVDRLSIKQEHSDITISTAHKSKGLEWKSVQLSSDLVRTARDKEHNEQLAMSPSDLRLLYVAATRAKTNLDTSLLSSVFQQQIALDKALPNESPRNTSERENPLPLTNKIKTTPVHSQFDDLELHPHQIKENLNTETLDSAESTSLGNHERFPLEEFSPQDLECEEQSTDQGQENKNQLTQKEIGNFSIESLYDQGERILGAPTIATLRNWLDWYSRNEDAITDPDQEILLEIRADEIDDQLREMKRKSTPDLTYPRALQSRESNQAQPSTLLTEPNPTYDPSKTPAELIEELVEQLADCLSNPDPTASPEPFVQLIKNFAIDPMQLSSSTRPVVDLIFKQKKILSDLSETDACKWASTESKKFLENVEKNFYQS